MPKIGLTQVISKSFVNSFTGIAQQRAGGTNLGAALRGESTGITVSAGLRLGAQAFGNAVSGLNSLIGFVNVTQSTLESIAEITDKMISLTERATKASTSSQSRRRLETEFHALGKDFQKILDETEIGDRKLLDVSDLSDVFVNLGLDQEESDSIAEVFKQFVLDDGDNFLASTKSQGERPIPIPKDAYRIPLPPEQVNDGSFQATNSNAVGSIFDSMISADVDEDGRQDLIGVNSGSVGVLEGNGDGTFQSVSNLSVETGSGDLVSGDFDGDGNVDIVTANSDTSDSISVLLGNGNGTFNASTSYATTTSGTGILAEDIDGDGNLDIVTQEGSNFFVSLGNGDGTFNTSISTAATNNLNDISAAYIDGDNNIDIIGTNNNNEVEVFLGNGNGTFAASTQFSAGATEGFDVTLADINNDNDIDVIFNSGTGAVGVLEGDGTGSFGSVTTFSVEPNAAGVATTDFDKDGNLDIVTSHTSGGDASILFGNGDGTFDASVSLDTNGGTGSQVLADFNNDGVTDIANALDTGGGTAGVILSNTTFETEKQYKYLSGNLQEFSDLFDSSRSLKRRPDAYALLNDLEALREQITTNIDALSNATQVILDNIELVRSAGFAFLNLSDSIADDAEADEAARALREEIRKSPAQALAQAENLEPIAVAALAFDDGDSITK